VFDVVERMALTVEHDDFVRPELAHLAEDVWCSGRRRHSVRIKGCGRRPTPRRGGPAP
jgi:hypothetical protein